MHAGPPETPSASVFDLLNEKNRGRRILPSGANRIKVVGLTLGCCERLIKDSGSVSVELGLMIQGGEAQRV